MRVEADALKISELIIHELPKQEASEKGKPNLSDLCTPPDKRVFDYFRVKASKELTANAFRARFDPETDSPMPDLIRKVLADDGAEFVGSSKRAATRLHDVQGRSASPGLLTLARCKFDGRPGLLVIKLEKSSGVQVTEHHEGNKLQLVIAHIENLVLTDTTRIFKVGLFYLNKAGTAKALVCDTQTPGQSARHVARFFLERFLGCELQERADAETQKLYRVATAFFNSIEDPKTKAEYHIALLAELNSNAGEISPTTFASRALHGKHREEFVKALEEQGIDSAVKKDTTLIQAELRQEVWTFAHDMALSGKATSIKQRVKIATQADGSTQVQINDDIKRVGK